MRVGATLTVCSIRRAIFISRFPYAYLLLIVPLGFEPRFRAALSKRVSCVARVCVRVRAHAGLRARTMFCPSMNSRPDKMTYASPIVCTYGEVRRCLTRIRMRARSHASTR